MDGTQFFSKINDHAEINKIYLIECNCCFKKLNIFIGSLVVTIAVYWLLRVKYNKDYISKNLKQAQYRTKTNYKLHMPYVAKFS